MGTPVRRGPFFVLIMLAGLVLGSAAQSFAATSVTLTFYTNTASHAAIGAKMGTRLPSRAHALPSRPCAALMRRISSPVKS